MFYLGDNLVARGARSVVRSFRGMPHDANQENAHAYDQVYTQKVFTLPRYQQHMIDDYFTVQAYSGTRTPAAFILATSRSNRPGAFVDPRGPVHSLPGYAPGSWQNVPVPFLWPTRSTA